MGVEPQVCDCASFLLRCSRAERRVRTELGPRGVLFNKKSEETYTDHMPTLSSVLQFALLTSAISRSVIGTLSWMSWKPLPSSPQCIIRSTSSCGYETGRCISGTSVRFLPVSSSSSSSDSSCGIVVLSVYLELRDMAA